MDNIKDEVKIDHGLFVCPHNSECRCKVITCGVCGWNPEVSKARIEKIVQKWMESPA